ncbi:MAG: PUR family DNA/RNA-binding protein [Bacteroidales bacterium]|nr:PUR family DNA/RNA-binding protein [Bacteroidales bacterium]
MDNRDSENRKEELYSQVISAGKRRYFFDVKETRGGDKFITISESRKLFDNRTGEFYFEKNKMFLYKEDFEKFQKGLENAFSFVETGVVPPSVEDGRERFHSEDINMDGSSAIDDIDLNF